MPKFVSRIPTLFIAALAGAVFGVVGTVAHAATIWGIPVGLVLGIVGAAALMLAIRLLADRWASVAAGVGITLAVIVFSGEGPGGSVIAPAGMAAVVWTVACPLVAVLIVAWPEFPTSTRPAAVSAVDASVDGGAGRI
ncbi:MULTISPECIES: histidinol dehydrogenase [Bacteria]